MFFHTSLYLIAKNLFYLQRRKRRSIINTVNTVMLDEKLPIFIKIKDDYKRLIKIGALNEGDALPSVREIALNYGVNPNTAQRALTLLVEEGFVESIPKKGFYVKKQSKKQENKLRILIKDVMNQGYTKEEIKKELEEMDDDKN